jgi:hypothetical protein
MKIDLLRKVKVHRVDMLEAVYDAEEIAFDEQWARFVRQ